MSLDHSGILGLATHALNIPGATSKHKVAAIPNNPCSTFLLVNNPRFPANHLSLAGGGGVGSLGNPSTHTSYRTIKDLLWGT